jgi:hypothetical protein
LPGGLFGILHCVQDDRKNLQKQTQKQKQRHKAQGTRHKAQQKLVGWRRIYFPTHHKVRDGWGTRALWVGDGKRQQQEVVK